MNKKEVLEYLMENEIVFLESNPVEEIAFTTSKVIAKRGEIQHETIVRLISKYENDLCEFGILRFEIGEIKGRGQPEKIYHLNEPQATLLITYMQNTPPVRQFKKDLVRQFYVMQQEIYERQFKQSRKKKALPKYNYNKLPKTGLRAAIDRIPDKAYRKSNGYKFYDLIFNIVCGEEGERLRIRSIDEGDIGFEEILTRDVRDKLEVIELEVADLIDQGKNLEDVTQILREKYWTTGIYPIKFDFPPFKIKLKININ